MPPRSRRSISAFLGCRDVIRSHTARTGTAHTMHSRPVRYEGRTRGSGGTSIFRRLRTLSVAVPALYSPGTWRLLMPYLGLLGCQAPGAEPSLAGDAVAGPGSPGRAFGAPFGPPGANGRPSRSAPTYGIRRGIATVSRYGAVWCCRDTAARDNDAMRQERKSATPAGNRGANRGDLLWRRVDTASSLSQFRWKSVPSTGSTSSACESIFAV